MRSHILYLAADDVNAAMPQVAERLEFAQRTMTALVADAELPPKIGVHPRPGGSFAHAMPATLRPATGGTDTTGDLLGIKWVAGFPENRARGLPAIHALVVLSDPTTGEPRAILDGGPITAQRTAAVSGVAIARFGPLAAATAGGADHRPRATIVGAGVQGRSHLEVLAHTLPGVVVTIVDRHADRAAELADIARGIAGIDDVHAADGDPRAATVDADVVITAASFTDPARRQTMDDSWLAPDALVVPSVAASSGSPRCTRPPTPAYSPSEFSRTITQSSSGPVTARSGLVMPGRMRVGRTLAYWSNGWQMASRKPHSVMWSGTSGAPAEPNRMAS